MNEKKNKGKIKVAVNVWFRTHYDYQLYSMKSKLIILIDYSFHSCQTNIFKLLQDVWWLKAVVLDHYYFWLFKFGGMSKKNQKEPKKTNNLLTYFNKNKQSEDKNIE